MEHCTIECTLWWPLCELVSDLNKECLAWTRVMTVCGRRGRRGRTTTQGSETAFCRTFISFSAFYRTNNIKLHFLFPRIYIIYRIHFIYRINRMKMFMIGFNLIWALIPNPLIISLSLDFLCYLVFKLYKCLSSVKNVCLLRYSL